MQPNQGTNPTPSAVPTSQEVGAEARQSLLDEYASKTSARIISAADFESLKERGGFHVVGVMGFSGQWAPAKLEADPALKAAAEAATVALTDHLKRLKET